MAYPLTSGPPAAPPPQVKGRWSSPWYDVCAQPGGCVLCLYATACPCCAAGDVAGDAQTTLHEPGACYKPSPCCSTYNPCGVCCAWPCDRRTIADKYGIADGLAHPALRYAAFLASCATCVPCLLIQE